MTEQGKTKVDQLREALKARKEAEEEKSQSSVASRRSSASTDETTKDETTSEDITYQIRAAEEDAKAHYDKLLRVMAEFENFKKRNEKERVEAIRFANERLIEELLPVLDHLDEALASADITANGIDCHKPVRGNLPSEHSEREGGRAPSSDGAPGRMTGRAPVINSGKSLAEGVELVRRQFLSVLAKHGLEPIEPETGVVFDPSIHEAITTVEEQGVASGAVVTRFRRGYKLHGRVLRAAMVSVAK